MIAFLAGVAVLGAGLCAVWTWAESDDRRRDTYPARHRAAGRSTLQLVAAGEAPVRELGWAGEAWWVT